MPRNVRNFWLDACIDGETTPLSSGPRSTDGGMSVYLRIRDNGQVAGAISVQCFAIDDRLELVVKDENGKEIYRKETIR